MRAIVNAEKIGVQPCAKSEAKRQDENFIKIEKLGFKALVEKICQNDECRYPLLALRILIHIITGIDGNGRIYISARHLAKSLNVHYDTVTKCLKYLREINVLRIEK